MFIKHISWNRLLLFHGAVYCCYFIAFAVFLLRRFLDITYRQFTLYKIVYSNYCILNVVAKNFME